MRHVLKTTITGILFAMLLVSATAYAESDVKEGYDENTEISIKGTVVEVMREMRGPVMLKIRLDSKTYNVVTAPMWYLQREGVAFDSGEVLEVRGSKYFGKDGNLYIVARQVKNSVSGKAIILRDSCCLPLWKGHRMHNRVLP